MTHEKSVEIQGNKAWSISVYIVTVSIFFVWYLLTPDGILGKADAIGYAICHRIDTRSFHIGLRQFSLCIRCTGQYLGAIISLAYMGLFSRNRTGIPSKRVIAMMVPLVLIYIVDGVNSFFTLTPLMKYILGIQYLYAPSNTLRLFTGTGMGLVIGILLYPAFIGSISINPDPQPSIGGLKSFWIIVGSCFIADLLILTGSKFILYPASLISSAGVIVMLTMAYTIVWIKIFHWENMFSKLHQIVLPVCCGFSTALLQIAFFDFFRYIITRTWNGFILG